MGMNHPIASKKTGANARSMGRCNHETHSML
jgi:hypothetical protein